MKRLTAAELSGMTMKQMEAHIKAERLGIKINKSKTKAGVVKEILTAYAEREAERQMEAAKAGQPAGEPSRPVNPALEMEIVDTAVSTIDPESEPIENRGGARPGAGRPKGMTAERARMTRLSECPHPAILGLLEMLFDGWAMATSCPGVALSKQEAFDLALPWTNVMEYWGVTDYIPVWIELAITCTWNTLNVVKCKARLAREAAAERKAVKSMEGKPDDEPTS